MIVVLPPVGNFIKDLPGTEILFQCNAALGQQLQGTVNRGVSDVGMLLANLQVQILGGNMVRRPKKFIQNDFTLTGQFEALLTDVFSKSLPFIDHAPSNEIDFQLSKIDLQLSSRKTGRYHKFPPQENQP
jgi:hypothetical protein